LAAPFVRWKVAAFVPPFLSRKPVPGSEAGGILHRDPHVVLGALPRLEFEPLGLEIVGGRGCQAVQDGEEVVGSGNRHLFRISGSGWYHPGMPFLLIPVLFPRPR
jgi:hypothetical protein